MSDLVTIEATKREKSGKGYSRKIRANDLIPANLMQKGQPSLSLELNPKLLPKAWKSGKQFNLVLDGQTRVVKIHELQINPVKRNALHVDLIYV